jgi:hypothetical protein
LGPPPEDTAIATAGGAPMTTSTTDGRGRGQNERVTAGELRRECGARDRAARTLSRPPVGARYAQKCTKPRAGPIASLSPRLTPLAPGGASAGGVSWDSGGGAVEKVTRGSTSAWFMTVARRVPRFSGCQRNRRWRENRRRVAG